MGWIRQLDQQNLSFWQFCENVTFFGMVRWEVTRKSKIGKVTSFPLKTYIFRFPPCHMGGLWKVFPDASGRITIIPTPEFRERPHTCGQFLASLSGESLTSSADTVGPSSRSDSSDSASNCGMNKACGATRAAITRIASSLVSLCGGSSSRSRLTSRIALLALRLK